MSQELNDRNKVIIDASAVEWMREREGAKLLMPHPNSKEDEIDFITQLGGPKSNLYRLYQARIHEKAMIKLSHGEKINMEDEQEAVLFILLHSASLNALRSEQIVRILEKKEPLPEPSLIEAAIGRFRRK